MSVMTVFCHGTKSFSDEKQMPDGDPNEELVWIMEKNYLLPRAQQSDAVLGGKYLLQGVGSKVEPTALELGPQAGGLGSHSKGHLSPSLLNQMSGNGVGHNIRQFLTLLDYTKQQGQSIDKLNLLGWSRGGVTCVRLAQELNKHADFKHIEVNIFAADPVPGAGRHQGWAGMLTHSKKYSIPPNVKRYLQTMAMHEAGTFFRPLEPAISKSHDTQAVVLGMPGNHGDVVYAGRSASGRLTLDLAIRFLRVCGSEGVEVPGLAARQLAMNSISDEYAGLRMAMRGNQTAELAQNAGIHPMTGSTTVAGIPLPTPFQGAHGFYHSRAHVLERQTGRRSIFMNKHEQYIEEKLNPASMADRTQMRRRRIYPPALDAATSRLFDAMYGS